MQIIGQICAFEAPFGGLGATYDVHLKLIGKLVCDFLLVIIELFSLGAFVLSQFTRVTDRRTDGWTDTFAVRKTACILQRGKNYVQYILSEYTTTRNIASICNAHAAVSSLVI